MCLRMPAQWAALWQASCKVAGVRWRPAGPLGNSHSVGRAGGPPPGAQDLQRQSATSQKAATPARRRFARLLM